MLLVAQKTCGHGLNLIKYILVRLSLNVCFVFFPFANLSRVKMLSYLRAPAQLKLICEPHENKAFKGRISLHTPTATLRSWRRGGCAVWLPWSPGEQSGTLSTGIRSVLPCLGWEELLQLMQLQEQFSHVFVEDPPTLE